MNPSIEAQQLCSARGPTLILLEFGLAGRFFFEIMLDMPYNLIMLSNNIKNRVGSNRRPITENIFAEGTLPAPFIKPSRALEAVPSASRSQGARHVQSAFAHFTRAANYYRQACYVQAIQHYLAGLHFDSTQAAVYADLAKTYEMVGYWDEALDCLDTALQLHPNYPPALRRQARIFEEKALYESLVDEIDLDLEPSPLFRLQRQVKERLALPSTIRRKFFVLKYDKTIPSGVLWTICQLIERTRREVGDIFQSYPQRKIAISVEDTSHQCTTRRVPRWAAATYDGSIQLTCPVYREPNLGILLTLIRHEWVHLLVDLLTQRQCPTWLDEGLAQIISRPMMPFERQQLRTARQNGRILSPDELMMPFNEMDANQRHLAYLQSATIVEYLIKQFGIRQIRELLGKFSSGLSTEMVLWKTIGKTMNELVAVCQ